jgi:hypothetical protein
VAVTPTIHTCLASGTKIRLTELERAERRVDLLAGRVAVALFPLPQGERFSIVSEGVWSSAVGTAFSVERLANSTVRTIVHEGKVAVGPEHGAEVVTAHKIGLAESGTVKISPLLEHGSTQTGEWTALGLVAGRSIEAEPLPPNSLEPAAAPEPEALPEAKAPAAVPRPVAQAPRTTAPSHTVEAPSTPAPSATELLGSARQALREQRWSDAASSYSKIVSEYPSSPEAHTVLVPLARLELDRLSRPAAALDHLNAYLATGGALQVEAELNRIRAYRALGRTADEAKAIDTFLASHPNNLEAAQLRERRNALGN